MPKTFEHYRKIYKKMNHLKGCLIIFLSIYFILPTYAQKVDYDRVVTPSEMGTRDFKEFLVQIAWMNSPENEALEFEKNIKELEVKTTRKEWTNDLQVTFNMNETHLLDEYRPDPDEPVINLFPIFNASATFKLGRFLNQKHNVDIAKERVKIADNEINQKKLNVRMEVLKRYEEYEKQVEVFRATSKAEDDASSTYILITDLFKVDKATAEDYLAASTSYHTAVEKRIRANSDMNIARLTVEEMIGISLDEAKRLRK